MSSLSTLIASADLSLDISPVSTRPNSWGDKGGPMRPMHFCYTLMGNGESLTGFYSAGCGNLASYKPSASGGLTVYQADKMEEERKRYRPTESEVISSLLLDASIDPEATFREWCYDMGVDLGNPADALDTYNALRDCRAKMRAMLGSSFEAAVELAAEM